RAMNFSEGPTNSQSSHSRAHCARRSMRVAVQKNHRRRVDAASCRGRDCSPMTHPLDNAVWHALTGPQRGFGQVGERSARYRPEISPIAAVADESDAAFADLAQMTSPGQIVALLCDREFPARDWQPLMRVELGQWIQEGPVADAPIDGILELGAPDQDD